MNTTRRNEQDRIFEEAKLQAEQYKNDNVLVLSGADWSHGIIGIVAAKILETYKKPTYVLEEMGDEAKGSARSYGDFSAADAIHHAGDIVTKGGGHKYAAGLTLPTANIPAFRKAVNDYYRTQKLFNQTALLLPEEDIVASFVDVTEDLIEDIALLEPFGNGNPEPILSTQNLRVFYNKRLGANEQHIKLGVKDMDDRRLYVIAFNAPEEFFIETGERVTIWYKPSINEWQGRRSVEGQLLRIERA